VNYPRAGYWTSANNGRRPAIAVFTRAWLSFSTVAVLGPRFGTAGAKFDFVSTPIASSFGAGLEAAPTGLWLARGARRAGAVLFIVAGLFLSLAAQAPAHAVSLQRDTASGVISGLTHDGVVEWRGIPYAAPPVGSLRFRPPTPPATWSGVRDGSRFAPACLQPSAIAADGSVSDTEGSEDCLYLNVTAPTGATSASHLAVMVHLHGGGNTFGKPYADASAFVARGVLVVTVAYRLGALGFVGHPGLSAEGGGTSGEYGLLDQLAALRWVHENIATFGGDPGNVTLFGLSAGSADTVAIMASPLSSGLMSKAAVQGDVYWAVTGAATIADAENIGLRMADAVGCGSSDDVAGCLRTRPASALVRAAGVLDVPPWTGGRVLPESPLRLLAQRANGIPLLVGVNREGQAGFAWPYLADPFLRENFVHTSELLVGPPRAAEVRSVYPESQYESSKWAYITMETDSVTGCPTRQLANTASAKAPVYRYLFTHVYKDDPQLARLKASHAFEDPFLWGNFDLFPGLVDGYAPTPAELVLSQRMTNYWVNFAKSGDPNGPALPTWPRYDTVNEPLLTLDDKVATTTGYHVTQCALLDRITPFAFYPFDNGRKIGLFDFLP
jgi:para-nitrobenzyl esterase